MEQPIPVLSRLIFTLAAVALVVVVNRPVQGDQASADAVRCELDPPLDTPALEACLARSPLDVEVLLDLAAAYDGAGRAADAHAAYRRAVEIDPRDADAWLRFAASLHQAGDLDGAARAAAAALARRPNDPQALKLAALSARASQSR